jgi:Fur family ferric uptake transcriptional regulator
MPSSHDNAPARKHAELPLLAERLRRRSRRMTGPRQAILDVLRRHRHPLAIKAIFSGLCAGDCDLATVYRSMHLLQEMGMVKRFDFGDGIARFELLAEGDDGHHHHLVCLRCSEVVEIEDCAVGELDDRIAVNSGFTAVTHKLEFFGICPDCQ